MRLLRRDDDLDLGQRYPPPEAPFTEVYADAHRRFVCDVLDDQALLARFRSASRLPVDFGVGLDERVVEYPWLLSRGLAGRVLDAGSTLNHPHLLDRVLPSVNSLHIVTLAPEPQSFVDRGVSYVFADLRELPFRERLYDCVVSLSTVEHVGMDNSQYGGASGREGDPAIAAAAALAELNRVLAPEGRLLVTVPYGRREDYGWFRQFGTEDLDALIAAAGARAADVTVYAYSRRGWQLSSLREAAGAVYREASESVPDDRAAAARAVACVELAPR
jgi:SAM-dependent methyltransferase